MNTRKLPDAILARLAQLWPIGLSARECANTLNAEFGTTYTRNAVIGMVHRHIAPRTTHAHKMNRAKIREDKLAKIAERNALVEAGAVAKLAEVTPMNIRIEDRTDGQCPFPMWASDAPSGGPNFPVCGCDKPLGAPYCKGHMAVTHHPAQTRKTRAEGFTGGPKRAAMVDYIKQGWEDVA